MVFGCINWGDNLNNPENKKVCFYFQQDEGRNLVQLALIINNDENTKRITKETTEFSSISNHKEANTKVKFSCTYEQ